MPRRETEPLKREHVWLYRDDADWIRDRYGDSIGVAKAIRNIVRGFRRKVEDKAGVVLDQDEDEVSLEELNV